MEQNLITTYLKKTDWVYLALCVFCSALSCLTLASIGYAQGGFEVDEMGAVIGLGKYNYAFKQALGAAIGLVAAFCLSMIDYRSLARIWPVHVVLTWGAVLPTLILHDFPAADAAFVIGYSAGNGSENYSWYKLGGFTVQPTEFAKISFILTLAMHLDNVRSRINDPWELVKLLAHIAVPMLVIHVQGDDGTALIFGIIGCFMLFTAGLSWKYIAAAVGAVAAAAGALLLFAGDKLSGYQWYRIIAIFDPENETGWAATDAIYDQYTYQQAKGETAIGAGGIFGRGFFTDETVSIPYAHNDFIFSWLGNAAGFVGCAIAVGVLFALVFRTFFTGQRSADLLGTYICAGVGGALFAQIVVNLGMNLRVLPVIGITLPFYSAGMSSTIMMYISVGLVLSVYTHNKKHLFIDN